MTAELAAGPAEDVLAGPAGPDTAARFRRWLETGEGAEALFAPDVFADVTRPHWRVQASGPAAVVEVRRTGHPDPGAVRVERLDPTPRGWVMQFEERWTDAQGEAWYCRELIRADVTDGLVSQLAVYCCGDWDEAAVRRHAAAVTLLRP